MNYHDITKDDMLNGDGLRVVLWVAGCDHHCEGCQNPVTWNPEGGIPFDNKAKHELFTELEKDYISGITFSGGDPLHPKNRNVVGDLIKSIKESFPTKTVWIYTGYKWEDIKILKLINDVDVLVDGEFEQDNLDVNYPWAGSTNQRIINVQESLKRREIILWK